jgi:DNA polymerase IV
MAWYFHVDMDAFFASVEQALDPTLRGKPVIVGGRDGRGVVTSASYEARKYGVHSAMPGFQARRLCPHGIFLPNRRKIYGEFSKKIFAILEQYSPDIQAISIDEGIVDLTGTEKLFGPPVNTAQKILKRIRTDLGLPVSGGLSSNRVVAKIAATLAKPNGFLQVPFGSEEAFLSPLPVESVPGVGPKTHKELLRLGVKTIGDLLTNPGLRRRFLDLDGGSQEERRRDHSIGNETTLDAPLKERDEMKKVLWELVEEVGSRLRKETFYARCITVKIRYTNFKTITRSRTLLTPTCFDREIFEVVHDLLQKNLTPGRMVRLLGVSASSLLSSGWQDSIFDLQRRRTWEKLYRGIDRLRRKYGEEAIGAATAHIRTR